MTEAVLPDIPRILTALAEWAACLTYILLLKRRLPGLRLALMAVGSLVLLIGVHEISDRLPLAFWTPGMLAALAVMYGFLALGVRTSPMDTGYLLARAFVLAELVASLHWQLHVFFFPESAYLGVTIASVGLIYGACFTVAFRIERRLFPDGRAPGADERALAAAAAIAVVTFLMSNLSFVTANTPFSGQTGMEVFYIRTLVDLAGYAALLALHSQRQQLRRMLDVEAMNQLVQSQHQRYLQSKRNIDEVNRKYHDLKHYITAFRSETDPSSKANYLDKLEESISGYDRQVETGNGILDAVLTAKLAEAAEHQVEVTTLARGTLLEFMEPLDVSALFGNALDNAVYAAKEVTDQDRRLVRISVQARDSFVVAEVENSFDGALDFDDGFPRSTKPNRQHHGYGLPNMRQIVEGYGGSLTVAAEQGWFSLTVVLPHPHPSAG